MKDKKFLYSLSQELSKSNFDLVEHLAKKNSRPVVELESELVKRVSGGRHEKTNSDGSGGTTFIKAGPIIF